MTKIWETFTNENQWKQYLQNLVTTNYKALLKSIVLIHDLQTDEEKQNKESQIKNSVGFSRYDAEVLSKIAIKLKRCELITKNEMYVARAKMPKYWRQLMNISKNQIEQKKIDDKLRQKELFEQHNETLRRCAEDGISCEYGICDECPVTNGLQIRLFGRE